MGNSETLRHHLVLFTFSRSVKGEETKGKGENEQVCFEPEEVWSDSGPSEMRHYKHGTFPFKRLNCDQEDLRSLATKFDTAALHPYLEFVFINLTFSLQSHAINI